jgi:CheY-like chemotaxis protein
MDQSGRRQVEAMTTQTADRFQPRRILVAEDVEVNRDILADVLGSLGHQLAIAVDGAQALELVRQQSFDLVLMDVQMPTMVGLEATRRIRALDGAARNVPILALSANTEEEDKRCIAAGMNECLPKPFDWVRMKAAIARYGATGGSRAPATPSGAPLQQPRPGLVNTETLAPLERMMGPQKLRAMVRSGVDSYELYCKAICDPAAGAAPIAAQAHKLKGSAGTLGLGALGAVAAGIEDALAAGLPVDALRKELADTMAATHAELITLGILEEDRPAATGGGPSDALALAHAQLHAAQALLQQREAQLAKLQDAHDLLVSTLDATSDGIFTRQLDGTFFFNIRTAELWGIPEEDIATIDADRLREFAIARAADPVAFLDLVEQQGANPMEEQVSLIALKNGSLIERSVRPQFLHGMCVGNVITYRDVTDSARHEEEMAFNGHVLENSAPMFWIERDTGAIAYANRAACKHLGYPATELRACPPPAWVWRSRPGRSKRSCAAPPTPAPSSSPASTGAVTAACAPSSCRSSTPNSPAGACSWSASMTSPSKRAPSSMPGGNRPCCCP